MGYETISCGNLYAFVLERVAKIANEKSIVGQIVPVSIISTPGYKSLRELYIKRGINYFSSYNIHPCCLFEGANSRLSILISIKSEIINTYVTGYKKWYAVERENIFNNLIYNMVSEKYFSTYIERALPKIGNKISDSILNKFLSKSKISNYFVMSGTKGCKFYYRRAFGAFVLFYDFIPKMYDENNKKMEPTELKEIIFNKDYKDVILGIYHSNLFYFSTYTFSDCRNINKPEIEEFYIDLDKIDYNKMKQLIALTQKLSKDLIDNSIMMNYNYSTGRRKFQAFFPRKSKSIIDEIDKVLAEHYGFTDEELDFIINYDIKYRMGAELEGDE